MARDSSKKEEFLDWIDGHPRMAWWLVFISHVNLILGVAGVYGAFFH